MKNKTKQDKNEEDISLKKEFNKTNPWHRHWCLLDRVFILITFLFWIVIFISILNGWV